MPHRARGAGLCAHQVGGVGESPPLPGVAGALYPRGAGGPMVAEEVERILAPNPGLMTGRGTNSYLLGEGEVAVVDPGPPIDTHLEALVAAAERRGRLTLALVTHWHPDHFPAALELKRRLGVRVAGHHSL